MAVSVLKWIIFCDEQNTFVHEYVCSGSSNKYVLYCIYVLPVVFKNSFRFYM